MNEGRLSRGAAPCCFRGLPTSLAPAFCGAVTWAATRRQSASLPMVRAVPLAIQTPGAQNKNGRHPSLQRDRKASLGHSDPKKIPGTGEGESAAQVTQGQHRPDKKGGHPMNLLPPWSLYLALQTKVLKSNKVDDASWGCEAALNRILSSDPACDPRPVSDEDIDRWGRSEGRRERHRARLRRLHMGRPENEQAASERALHARQELRAVRELVSNEEWALLYAVSEGGGYDEIAARTGRSSGALRVRILRLRHRLSVALAA
jgi:hypothetical protein